MAVAWSLHEGEAYSAVRPWRTSGAGRGAGTSRGWRGGSSIAFARRNVGHGLSPGRAHRPARRKKQSLQLASDDLPVHPALCVPSGHGHPNPARPGGKFSPDENRAIPEAFGIREIAANYPFLGSVARARNACPKLSTGMTRRSPAWRRATTALSPAGTRKTSAPAGCADHPLLDASDRRDAAVELDLSRHGNVQAAIDVALPRLDDIEREGEPGRRPSDTAEIDLDVERQLDVGELLDLDADDRAPVFLRALDRSPPRPCASRRLPGPAAAPCRPPCAPRSAGASRQVSATGDPSTATITSVGSSLPAAGASGATATTCAPSGSALSDRANPNTDRKRRGDWKTLVELQPETDRKLAQLTVLKSDSLAVRTAEPATISIDKPSGRHQNAKRVAQRVAGPRSRHGLFGRGATAGGSRGDRLVRGARDGAPRASRDRASPSSNEEGGNGECAANAPTTSLT